MVVRKRKKNTRHRAKTTHGWGSMKKRRGAGNRGGRGNAGVGKRGAQKKPTYFKHTRYLGAKGFTRHAQKKTVCAINLAQLQRKLEQWVTEEKITKQGDSYLVDGAKIGFTKLLGSGNVTKKIIITIDHASSRAQERVKAAGGEVKLSTLPQQAKDSAEQSEKVENGDS